MRQLKLKGAFFYQVAYLDAQHILTMDTVGGHYAWRVWDLSKDEPEPELTPEQALVARRLFLPNGRQFLRTQGYWPEGELLPSAKDPDLDYRLPLLGSQKLSVAAFGPDGRTILLRQAGSIADQREYRTNFYVRLKGDVFALAQCAGMFHTMYTTLGAFSPNGKLAAMGSGNKFVAVWDLAERKELVQLEQGDKVQALAFTSNDRIAVAAGRTVRLWDLNKREVMFKPRAFAKYADALAVSPDLRLAAAGSRDGLVRLWDTATGREVKEYDWDLKQVNCVAFSPDGTTAAATGVGAVVLWDID